MAVAADIIDELLGSLVPVYPEVLPQNARLPAATIDGFGAAPVLSGRRNRIATVVGTLQATVGAEATELVLNGSVVVADDVVIKVGAETLVVSASAENDAGDTVLTVARGQQETEAAAHRVGAEVLTYGGSSTRPAAAQRRAMQGVMQEDRVRLTVWDATAGKAGACLNAVVNALDWEGGRNVLVGKDGAGFFLDHLQVTRLGMTEWDQDSDRHGVGADFELFYRRL